MYAAHVPVISNAARGDLEVFKRAALFAVLSIRQPVTVVPSQLDEVDRERASATCLFGWKRQAYVHLETRGRDLWERFCAVPYSDPEAAISLLLEVPGLGIVKAGFVAQLLGFDVACLDSRNVAREGRRPRFYEVQKHRTAALKRKVAHYVEETSGHAERYWDEWCEDAGAAHKLSALEISALHLSIVPDSFIPF